MYRYDLILCKAFWICRRTNPVQIAALVVRRDKRRVKTTDSFVRCTAEQSSRIPFTTSQYIWSIIDRDQALGGS